MNENPAFGAGLQPFMGIPSFMRLPVTRELDGVDVAILGVPFDSGTSYRSGTRFGPRKIREASLMIWGHNTTLNVTPTKKLKVVDYGDVSVIPTSIEHTMAAITGMAGEIINTGTKLITLGGDHSIALPLLRAHAKKHGPVSLVHIDAHIDTWEAEFEVCPVQPWDTLPLCPAGRIDPRGRVRADRHSRSGQRRERLRRGRRAGRQDDHHQ